MVVRKMPNKRRRKFLVRNEISRQRQNESRTRYDQHKLDMEEKGSSNQKETAVSDSVETNVETNIKEILNESNLSLNTIKTCSTITEDKQISASTSLIEVFNLINVWDVVEQYQDIINYQNDISIKKGNAHFRNNRRLDRYPRQHRIKIRSPKRRGSVIINDLNKKESNCNMKSVATEIVYCKQEVQVQMQIVQNQIESYDIDNGICANENIETIGIEVRRSNSLNDMCRICHGGNSLFSEVGPLISACICRGTVGRVHVKCLERWLTESGKSRCELCRTRYTTRRVHKYGVPKALFIWLLGQNAKQLLVDSLGIILMSPLAVFAAWLSGRTLAGLMTQEISTAPWPLASTFVLACMTLVCYYCWIVSAATRHALGWWIWYRSQYEVRLQLQGYEEDDDYL